ncbi:MULTISPECIES: hypothetical protein [unclassified Streptomyces]|uniref:hypothetical protein n=1 Tax=unclassified Streptomyces TaxID=2593676 RepID=UPI001AF811CD|nr:MULTISPECIES: hypothetical protein [unclassified Streptomyces]CAD5929932.1 conserved protein of unknown function [Streptomyces sp. KY75]CAD5988991.1 conserved protein of unknown function [Streptomyces sp. KY70]
MDGYGGYDGETLRAVVRVCEGASPAEVLDGAPARAWVDFDAGVRALDDRPWLLPRAPEEPVRPARTLLDRLRGTAPSRTAHRPPPPPPAIALCHADGRVREAALEEARTAPELRPLLVVRCSDWADPVRERSRVLLAELPGSALLPLAELILLLSRRTRGGFARSLLERALREGPAVDAVALMAHQDRATYRLAYRIAVERGLLTPAELATTAATCGDVTLQDLCAEAAVAALTATDGEAGQAAVLGRLLTARAARVRSAGVTALRRAGRHGEAEPFLADRSAVVRACARYVLRQGGIDPLPLYRALCAEPAAHPGAAAGLGECGERATDTGTLWALVEHPLPAVRVCAITGLRALEAVVRERLTSSLDDPSPAVVRAATRALLPEAAGIPETLLRERTAPDRPRAVRVAAERLLRAAGRALPG